MNARYHHIAKIYERLKELEDRLFVVSECEGIFNQKAVFEKWLRNDNFAMGFDDSRYVITDGTKYERLKHVPIASFDRFLCEEYAKWGIAKIDSMLAQRDKDLEELKNLTKQLEINNA